MTEFELTGRVANLSYNKAEWEALNPVLGEGEIGYESDTRQFKIGDGTTAWTELKYAGVDNETAQEITANTAARHTHDNKEVIDGITADQVTNWDSAVREAVPTGAITATVSDNTLEIGIEALTTSEINSYLT